MLIEPQQRTCARAQTNGTPDKLLSHNIDISLSNLSSSYYFIIDMAITSTPNPKKASAQKSSSARKNKENMGSQLEPSQQGKNPGAYQHKARSSTSGPASVQSKKLEEQLKKLSCMYQILLLFFGHCSSEATVSVELSVEKKKREAAEKALTQRVKYKSTMTEKIIKPKGSAGSQTKGYSLIHAMGLEGDREKYRLFQVRDNDAEQFG